MRNLMITCFIVLTANNIQAQDKHLKLWYDRPATQWVEALPLGNGRIGAMVYGGADCEEID